MKHVITVLQDDIDNGRRGSATRCAIALAACRDLFWDEVAVSGTYLRGYAPGGITTQFHAALPGEARAFIPRFDSGVPVEPFKFEVEVADGPAPAPTWESLSSWPAWAGKYAVGFSGTAKGFSGLAKGFSPASVILDEAFTFSNAVAPEAPLSYLVLDDAKPAAAEWKPSFGSTILTYSPVGWTPPTTVS